MKGEIFVLGTHAGQIPNPLLRGLGSFHTDDDITANVLWTLPPGTMPASSML